MQAKDTTTIPVRLDVLDTAGEVVHQNEYVKEKIVIGRILSADLRVDEPRVSRIHALIEIRDTEIVITDLASTHGTFVNGKKIVESRIKIGDTIRVGFVDIKVEKGSGKISAIATPHPDEASTFDAEETLVDIDRSVVDKLDRRHKTDRRKRDAFPEERRLEDRREGDRRIDQRKGARREGEPETPSKKLPKATAKSKEQRSGKERRQARDYERRVGNRRIYDRRVFDITSLERRIEERRRRKSDDDLLPEELEQAFTAPTHARELEVTVLWGDHILDVSNYSDPVILNVGESPKNHYVIPSVGIPNDFPLITIEDDGNAYLAFTGDMRGRIRTRDKIYSVEELTKEKFVRKYGSYYILALRRDDFAKLSIGTINFFILYVKPAPRIRPAPYFERDKLLLRTFIGSALLMLLLMLGLALVPEPKPVTIEMVPERFAKIIIRKRPKIPAPKAPVKQAQQAGSKKAEGAKAKKPEAKAGKPKTIKKPPTKVKPKMVKKKVTVTKKRPKRPTRRRKVVDKKRAKKIGILQMFNSSKSKNNLKELLDKDPGFNAFGSNTKAVRGQKLDATGAAGQGLKGVRSGGGGKTIGIDGPSTKGVGSGPAGSGRGEGLYGPGRLGKKGEHSVSVITENVQVLSGLPKDVINAIVQRHRGEIRRCYETARQRNPKLRGKVVMSFAISPNGVVTRAGVKESNLGSASLHRCIAARIRSWKFPKPEAPVVTEVSAYPFYLNPGN